MKGTFFGIGLRQRRNDGAPERIDAWLCSVGSRTAQCWTRPSARRAQWAPRDCQGSRM